MARVIEEHTAVFEAIADRDADRAVARMETHIEALELDMDTFRDLYPDYFEPEETLTR